MSIYSQWHIRLIANMRCLRIAKAASLQLTRHADFQHGNLFYLCKITSVD